MENMLLNSTWLSWRYLCLIHILQEMYSFHFLNMQQHMCHSSHFFKILSRSDSSSSVSHRVLYQDLGIITLDSQITFSNGRHWLSHINPPGSQGSPCRSRHRHLSWTDGQMKRSSNMREALDLHIRILRGLECMWYQRCFGLESFIKTVRGLSSWCR